MHNGTIRPGNTAEQFINEKYKGFIQGTTDSERFFYAVLSAIDELGLVEGVRSTVNSIRAIADYTALNIMVQTPETLIAVCEFNEANKSEWSAEDHYELVLPNAVQTWLWHLRVGVMVIGTISITTRCLSLIVRP